MIGYAGNSEAEAKASEQLTPDPQTDQEVQATAIDDDIVDTTEIEDIAETDIDQVAQALEEQDEADGAHVLDPATSERQYYRDPVCTLIREIWRPGVYFHLTQLYVLSADCTTSRGWRRRQERRLLREERTCASCGEALAFLSGKSFCAQFQYSSRSVQNDGSWKPTLLIGKQSRTGLGPIKHEQNEPPKYVVLDDRAAQELEASDFPRAYLVKFWNHDFGGNGTIRARRPHRGRPAIGDQEAKGDDRYHFARIGNRGDKYYFTGEKNYTPVIYKTADPKLAVEVFMPKKALESALLTKKELPWNKHGHNQFTPKDQQVKYGAPHKGVSWLRYKSRLNTYLPRDPDPENGLEGRKGANQSERNLAQREAESTPLAKPDTTSQVGDNKEMEDDETFWMESDDETRAAKRRKPYVSQEDAQDARSYLMLLGEADRKRSTSQPEPARRTKIQQRPDFFQQMIADQEQSESETSPVDYAGANDSGSYAFSLETELGEAKRAIDAQKEQIAKLGNAYGEAQQKIKELGAEVAMLKG